MAPRALSIHLGRVSKPATDVALFPDPAEIFLEPDPELLARVLPVIAFDLALAGQSGRAVFLYYEDERETFIEWQTDGQRITRVDPRWKSLRPFSRAPDRRALIASHGGFLALDRYEVSVEPPSGKASHEWPSTFERALRAAGAERPLARPRIGEQYPCYVQSSYVDEGSLIVAELPAAFLGLQSMYFYLWTADGRSFQQEMQMT